MTLRRCTRLQSAMEYLMTYGWAILLVAIALGALWELGFFGNSASPVYCDGASGFGCSNVQLYSNGTMTLSIIYFGSGILNVTGFSCTESPVKPYPVVDTNLELVDGKYYNEAFACPISNGYVGEPFSGYLWVTYSEGGTTGLVEQFATVSTKVVPK